MNFQRLLNFARREKDILPSVATGSALSGLFGVLTGGPVAGAAYGLGDLALAYPATLGTRAVAKKLITKPIAGIEPKVLQQGAETIANLGASIASVPLVDTVTAGRLYPQVQPTNISQEQQIMQEMVQRANVNKLDTQAVAPGTQFQTAGIEFLHDYIGRGPQQSRDMYAAALGPENYALLAEYGGLPRG